MKMMFTLNLFAVICQKNYPAIIITFSNLDPDDILPYIKLGSGLL